MLHKFIMPKLGWTMERGKVLKWLKKEGDHVDKGAELIEVETDKVTLKVEAPETGTLVCVLVNEGESALVNHVIGVISSGDGGDDAAAVDTFVEGIMQEQASSTGAAGAAGGTGAAAAARGGQGGHQRPCVPGPAGPAGKILASPKARALASERGVDLRRVAGTGSGGVITATDVEAAIPLVTAGAARIERIPPDPRLTVVKEEPVSGIREVIATRLYGSLQSSAQLTITTEVIVDPVSVSRDAINARRKAAGLASVSYTDLLVLVVSEVLPSHPKFNASFDGTTIRYFKEINIGVATATGRGLLVPVVWNTAALSLDEISKTVKGQAKGAREGTIGLDQLSGGTFTITNLGMFGIDAFTPIINPPEMAILGVGRIITKPAFKDGGIKPVQSMVLSLTFDHQVIDGHEGALFLQAIKDVLETPGRIESLHQQRDKAARVAAVMSSRDVPGDAIDVVIIGAGPAGNEAALKLASYGYAVTIIENRQLGGTCLNEGCVPVKHWYNTADLLRKVRLRVENSSGLAGPIPVVNVKDARVRLTTLLEGMRDGMARIYKEAGITVLEGRVSFTGPSEIEVTSQGSPARNLVFRKAIIATGAATTPRAGTCTTSELLARETLPASVALVGSSKLSVELGSILLGLGVEEVHVVWEGGVALPGIDKEMQDALVETLELDGIDVHEPATVTGIHENGSTSRVDMDLAGGKQESIEVDLVVDTSPRVPCTGHLALEKASIQTTATGTIMIDSRFQTTNPDVFAIGDVVNVETPYTYVAAAQGRAVADAILGMGPAGATTVPVGMFSLPPAASVGMTEHACVGGGVPCGKAYAPFSLLVGAHLVHELSGMMKVVFSPESKRVLGVQVIGDLAHEIISTATLAVRAGASLDDLVDALHLHPTIAEVFKEPRFQQSLKR